MGSSWEFLLGNINLQPIGTSSIKVASHIITIRIVSMALTGHTPLTPGFKPF